MDVLGGTFGVQYIHDYVEANALAAAAQRPFKQHFFGYIHVENGKIKLLREALNIVATARAFFPNGLADTPQPETA